MTTSNANRVIFRVVLWSAFTAVNSAAEMIPFSPPQFLEAGPHPADIVIEDFNGDGRPDFAVTSAGTEDSELGISVLLNLGKPLDLAQWADRVKRVDARCEEKWELPVIGKVTPPTAVLIRPDGYVAWTSEGTEDGLRDALTRWFGAPSTR